MKADLSGNRLPVRVGWRSLGGEVRRGDELGNQAGEFLSGGRLVTILS